MSRYLYAGTFLTVISAVPMLGFPEKGPQRHGCMTTTDSCQAIKRFLKSHYCGESPFGNGPANGCDIRVAVNRKIHAELKANFDCTSNAEGAASTCKQTGQIPIELSQSLNRELRRLGLPNSSVRNLKYRLLGSTRFSVVEAYYESSQGTNLWLCQVIAVFSDPKTISVVREVRYQKTDLDVPEVTTWTLIDIADANGDGEQELVMQGDSYEDHWFEVVAVKPNLSTKLLYSGLGYYL